MTVFFRVDASVEIGTGHVMRCLTLAEELRDQGAQVSFICREFPGNICDFIEEKGYRVHRLLWETKHADKFWLDRKWQEDAEQTKAAILPKIVDWLL